MSFSTLILKAQPSRYLIGAYLLLQTIFSILIAFSLSHFSWIADPVQAVIIGFSIGSLLMTTAYYLDIHEVFNRNFLQEEEAAVPVVFQPSLAEISTLSFLQPAKDAYLGTRMFTLDLFIVGVGAALIIDLTKPIDPPWLWLAELGAALTVWVFAVWLRRRAQERKQDYLDKLFLTWRYYILSQSLPESEQYAGRLPVHQERFKRLETYLGLGAWTFAQGELKRFVDEIEQILQNLSKQISIAQQFVFWCEQPGESQPIFGNLGDIAGNLHQLGFQFVESKPSNSLISLLEEVGKPLSDLSDRINRSEARPIENPAPINRMIGEKRELLDRAREQLPLILSRVERELDEQQYRFGLKTHKQ